MKKINIALIGAGYIADYHARGLLQQENVTISAVAAVPLKAAQDFAQKYNIEKATDDALSLTKDDNIDGVVLALPNIYHAPYAIEFLKSGKDVFVEKPLAMNNEEAEQVKAEAQKQDKYVMVGHMWRFDTDVNYVKGIIDSGALGKIIKTKGYGIHTNWGPEGWFTKKELAGGGALADMGVHAIDTVRYLLGDPQPKQVYAKISTQFGDYDVDDTGVIMITWDNGTVSVIESGWWQPHADGPEAATRLFGKKGFASVFPTELKLNINNKMGDFKPELPQREDHCDQIIYTRQMCHFVESIRNRHAPCPNIEVGQVVMKIVDAAYRSASENRAIDL